MIKISMNLPEMSNPVDCNAYECIRVNFLQNTQNIKCVGFISCHAKEGKTTISLQLAKGLGELGKKTLWIDANLRKTKKEINYEIDCIELDLLDFLKGEEPVNKFIYDTDIKNVHIVPSVKHEHLASNYLMTKRLEELIKYAKEKYEYVFIDTPPVDVVSDAQAIAELCDGVILVIEDEKVKTEELATVVELMDQSNCKIIGSILNKSKTKLKKAKGLLKKYYMAGK